MRRLFIIITLLGCNRQPTKDIKSNDLEILLNELPAISTPLKISSYDDLNWDSIARVSDSLFQRINFIKKDFKIYGKLFETHTYVAIIGINLDTVASEGYNASEKIIYTITKSGIKIDSFNIYPTSGADEFHFATNKISIYPDKRIDLIDSTYRADRSDEVPIEERGIYKLSVTHSQYKISEHGKFLKNGN